MKARYLAHLAVILGVLAVILLSAPSVDAECEPYPIGPDSPTGCVGDVAYGTGTASTWGGPGVARNDCVWPWTNCTPIRITSLDTGLQVVAVPSMYCDCWRGLEAGETGPNGELPRLVDLDPATVAALGLSGPGLWRVVVEPAMQADWYAVMPPERTVEALPDTAAEYNGLCRYELPTLESRTAGSDCSYQSDPAVSHPRGMSS